MSESAYADLNASHPVPPRKPVEIQPKRVGVVSIASLVLGIIALPGGFLPLFGLVLAAIAILVGIVAVVRASRTGAPRAFAITGLVLSILAMALAVMTTLSVNAAIDKCKDVPQDQLETCIKEV